jgi:tetratricopeptide (TPR) repeat protein
MRRKVLSLFLLFALGGGLAAENLEKTQKKELEIRAKVIIAEAKKLEASGDLAEARTKYAESQAMLETKDAADAIKHLDEELRKRVKDRLRETLKLYETQSYKEAIAALDDGMKFQTFQPVLAHNLALCYHRLGERGKAVEYLQRAISGTPDPKQKERLQQLLTFFITGENGSELDKERVVQVNRLTDSLGVQASIEDASEEPEERFSDDRLENRLTPETLKTSPAVSSHVAGRRNANLCAALDELKASLANSPAATFDRANCAESNGRPVEAVKLLQRYLELAPEALDGENVRVRMADLQSLLALPGESGIEIRRLYGSANGYLAERKYDQALAAFTKAASLAPDFALTHWKLALLHEAMGNVVPARENFTQYKLLVTVQSVKDDANLHLSTLDAKRSKYNEEVEEAAEILGDLLDHGLNLTFNLDENRAAVRAHRARIKKKQDRKKDQNRVGGFAVPYPYAQQELARASEHLQVALALFPIGAEANELMGLVYLQANDGLAATRSFDAVASQGLPVAFYAEMRGHKMDHGVKCELTRDQVHLIFLSSYDKKGASTPPEKEAGEDGLADLMLAPGKERDSFQSLDLSLSDIKKVETSRGLLNVKLAHQEFTLAPVYLPSFTPVEGPQARRFANNYTRLFIRYPGLEDSKLGAEGMSGGEKFALGYKIASSSMNIAANGFTGIGAIASVQDVISITRTIHAAMVSLHVSFASWEQTVDDQHELLAGRAFKAIPTEPASLLFAQDVK